jgi:pSer/pThr/pTyr-binding forkhead associated (FHA) protein
MDETIYKRDEKGKKVSIDKKESTARLRFKDRDLCITKTIKVGRDKNNDIVLNDDPLVSRMHATIEKEGEYYYIYDKDSTNGTYVNNNPIARSEKIQLHSGDIIRIGKTKLQII